MPTMTITVDAATAQRIATAVGRYLVLTDAGGAPRDAAPAEVQGELLRHLVNIVRDTEVAAATAAAVIAFVKPAAV